MGPRMPAAWLCSVVFDAARAFEGYLLNLSVNQDQMTAGRCNRSAP